MNLSENILFLCAIQTDPILVPNSDRETLARLFRQLEYKVGAEIGVGSGPFSEMICLHNPGLKLYCVDAWTIYKGYHDFTIQKELDIDYGVAIQRLRHYDVEFVVKWSAEAVLDFADGSLDFVYIDANHDSPWIDDDIRAWSPKVRSGGIVAGHDYVTIHPDVIRAVDRYTIENNISPWFLVGNKAENTEPMTVCSWFWVQP